MGIWLALLVGPNVKPFTIAINHTIQAVRGGEKWGGRETDRERGRETDRERGRDTDRERGREMDREMGRKRDR